MKLHIQSCSRCVNLKSVGVGMILLILYSLSLSSSLSGVLSTIVRHLMIFVVSFFMFLLLIL
jgi:hypothetical protein